MIILGISLRTKKYVSIMAEQTLCGVGWSAWESIVDHPPITTDKTMQINVSDRMRKASLQDNVLSEKT